MYVENQKNIFEKYRDLNSFISADEFSDEDLKNAIDTFYSGVFQFAPRLIDGKSGIRILKYFKQFQMEEEVSIRTMEETDLLKRSEEHTSELQSLMRLSYAVFCLQKKTYDTIHYTLIPTVHTYTHNTRTQY